MVSLRLVLVALLALTAVGCAALAPTPNPSPNEQAARAVFVQLMDAARKRDAQGFRALIAPADLKEMDALEKEKPGFMVMFMDLVAAGGDPKDYQAETRGDQVRFVRRVQEKTKDMTSTQTTTVTMLRQDGAWRFGKPRP